MPLSESKAACIYEIHQNIRKQLKAYIPAIFAMHIHDQNET